MTYPNCRFLLKIAFPAVSMITGAKTQAETRGLKPVRIPVKRGSGFDVIFITKWKDKWPFSGLDVGGGRRLVVDALGHSSPLSSSSLSPDFSIFPTLDFFCFFLHFLPAC